MYLFITTEVWWPFPHWYQKTIGISHIGLGEEKGNFIFPHDTTISKDSGNSKKTLGDFKNRKLVSFVSEDCPVSMVATVVKAREIAYSKKDVTLIVAPLEELSEKHLSMNRMVSGGNMYFVDDEKWSSEKKTEKLKLPLFFYIDD